MRRGNRAQAVATRIRSTFLAKYGRLPKGAEDQAAYDAIKKEILLRDRRENAAEKKGIVTPEQRYARRLMKINERRAARGKSLLRHPGVAGDKPGHPFRGNQYRG